MVSTPWTGHGREGEQAEDFDPVISSGAAENELASRYQPLLKMRLNWAEVVVERRRR